MRCGSGMRTSRDVSKLRLLLLIVAIEACHACPMSCVCKWKNGKQTVECVNKDLLVIPEGMDSGTQVLEFSGNNLRTLHREKFLRMDLINLQRIYLSRCGISSIDDRTFKGLTNLVELDLSGNLLETIPTEAFIDCPSLMRLTLNSNPIKSVRRAAFHHLSFLNTLELTNCKISKVEEGAFQSLYSLEWLYLNGNKLTALKGTRYFPETLKGVQLHDNPWECDCHILDMHSWLWTVPHSVEPVCDGPHRLYARTIKSIPAGELACLPDVSPTTFFLEIGEGKNVSLLCQVHAIPEARVSWWFQGQLLQNDSMIAPGVHLLYYLEEGTVEKRSELFIYNANTEDNGTFICNAENPAGMTQANFTIRVVVKHEPRLDRNEVPFEFILMVMSAAALSVLLLLLVVILSIIKCHRNSRLRKKRNNSKVALSHSTKDNLLQESLTECSQNSKESVNIKFASQEEETILYTAHPAEEILRTMSPIAVSNQLKSPTVSLRRYQLEQNPDLINGTESIGRHRGAAECDRQLVENYQNASTGIGPTAPDFQSAGRDLYVLTSDVHLNPVGLLDTRQQPFNGTFYRTLPHNRCLKRQSAANPAGRYSREAEFLQMSSAPASFEHYCSDVRYTADGYPVRAVPGYVSPSPDSHKSDSIASSSEPCCSATKIKWPSCVPAANVRKMQQEASTTKVSVGAQTQTDDGVEASTVGNVKPSNKLLNKVCSLQETLNESPDEGYEGESVDTNSCHCETK